MSDKPKRKTAAQPPVSAHPAFPVIVALWFAALFGIGSMVLPIGLFEGFALTSGLADVYAAAQPPLGATARIAVAIAAGIIGAGAGLFVARRIASAQTGRPVTRRAAATDESWEVAVKTAKRPISAHEELGEGGLDADEPEPAREPIPGRRRPLAVTDENAPSDFLSFAPLPGRSANEAEEPLDLVGFDAPVDPAEEAEPEVDMATFGTASLSRAPIFEEPHFVTQPAALATEAEAEPATAPLPLADRSLGDLGMVELVERFAQALERHKNVASEPSESEADEVVAIEPATAGSDQFAVCPDEVSATDHPTYCHPDSVAPPAVPAAFRPFGFEEDEDESELPDLDLTAALSRGRADFAPAASVLAGEQADDEASEEESEAIEEAGYTSLLAMKSPFGLPREPVRIEEEAGDEGVEPVVVFPGQSARDPFAQSAPVARPFDAPLDRAGADGGAHGLQAAPRPAMQCGDTERALREALEKLQRLSGAA